MLCRRQTALWAIFFLVAPILVWVLEIGSTRNVVALVITFVLFVCSVLLVPLSELAAFHRFTVWVLFFGFLLNVCYELLHSVFYTHFTEPGYTHPELVVMLFTAAVADAFISLGLLLAVTVLRRGAWRWAWPWNGKDVLFAIVSALGVQVLTEFIALGTGEWAYNSAMPIIPVLGVGLTPTLQMPLLILPVFWLAQHLVRSPAEAPGHLQSRES